MHVAAPDPHEYSVTFLHLHINTFLAELIDSLTLPKEHDVHFLSLWERVEEVSQCLVNFIILFSYVDRLSFFELFVDI